MSDRLTATPGQTIGPFFHDALPYERDSQLLAPGHPDGVVLHGTVYDGAGQPIPDALVEIRQADVGGVVPEVEGSLRRDGTVFTGWGRSATDAQGRYRFWTVKPGASADNAAFFSVVVFARGLLNRLFTRAYLPEVDVASDALLSAVPAERHQTLMVRRDADGSLNFDIHLQGPDETVFLTFPGHEGER